MPGSMSPLRVPITRPSSGVRPIEVSTGRPAGDRRRRRAVAQVQHDLVQRSSGRPRNSAACSRRTGARCRGIRSGGSCHRCSHLAVDRVGRRRPRAGRGRTRCRTPRRAARRAAALRATSMPARAGGLCSGASGDSSSSCAITASSISVGPVELRCRRAPPGARPRPGRGLRSCQPRPQANAQSTAPPRASAQPVDDVSPIRSTMPSASDSPESGSHQLVFHRRRAGVEHQHRVALHRDVPAPGSR